MKYSIIAIVCFAGIWYSTDKLAAQSTKNNRQDTISQNTIIKTEDIRIRDPFIFPDPATKTYYMYAQMGNRRTGEGSPQGVEVYRSKDLENWEMPESVLILPDDFWARKSVWAPEVHYYQGAYYLFVTLTSNHKITETPNLVNQETQWKRGTHIFRASSPLGPFEPLQKNAHTPADWMSLDGTLWEENGKPYMVFCHEWAQIFDGTIDVVELSPDLSEPVGEPTLLFKASAASWVRNMKDVGIKRNGNVTDGPGFHQNKKGELIMIWSSFGDQQYAIGQAISSSGSVFGPWKQIDEPLIKANGGHGMFFTTFKGQKMLAFHQPNGGGLERLHLEKIRENKKGLLETISVEQDVNKPNIVFIFSDDLSFRDLSAYGQTNYQTPNIDELIRHSTRFTQAYTGAPECAPSRGTMLTGLHVGHAPIRLNSSARGFEYLPDESYTFAEMLQEGGYKTGVVGKWGLGYKDTEGQPLNQGFDYHFGYLTHYEAHSYFPLVLYENNHEVAFPSNTAFDIQLLYDKERGNKQNIDFEAYYDSTGKLVKMDLRKGGYAPDLLDEKAVEFIEKNKAGPFFLYFTTNLPHGPLIVDDLRQMSDKKEMNLLSREWGAMVQRLDQSVGLLMDKLKADGIYDNTLIIFASDNGYSMHNPAKGTEGERVWPDDKDLKNKGPFKGGKFSVWEGGMRVPFSIHMPGQFETRVVSQPVWLLDLFPTLAAVAKQKAPENLDGYNLLPLIKGDQCAIPANRTMYFYKQNEQAIRQGAWFAIREHPKQKVQLFLLEEDQQATVNLASVYPEVTANMKELMDTIHEPHPWYWNPGDTPEVFADKQKKALELGQYIKRYRPNNLQLMPWEK